MIGIICIEDRKYLMNLMKDDRLSYIPYLNNQYIIMQYFSNVPLPEENQRKR